MIEFELTPREQRKVRLKAWLSRLFLLAGGEWLSRQIVPPALTIIAYHRILADDASGVQPYIGVPQSAFRDQLLYYRKHYEVVSLAEGARRLRKGELVRPLLAITFDDGYQDNLSLALPVLAELGLPATVFVTTDCLEHGQLLWPDRVRTAVYGAATGEEIRMNGEISVVPAELTGRVSLLKSLLAHVKTLPGKERDAYLATLPRPDTQGPVPRLMLDWEGARSLAAAGMEIGSHTLTHPILTRLEAEATRREIGLSRSLIEERVGRPCVWFAYPNGTVTDFSDLHVDQLQAAGYAGAVTTVRGVNRAGANRFRLRRTGVYGTDSLTVVRAKLAMESLIDGSGI